MPVKQENPNKVALAARERRKEQSKKRAAIARKEIEKNGIPNTHREVSYTSYENGSHVKYRLWLPFELPRLEARKRIPDGKRYAQIYDAETGELHYCQVVRIDGKAEEQQHLMKLPFSWGMNSLGFALYRDQTYRLFELLADAGKDPRAEVFKKS